MHNLNKTLSGILLSGLSLITLTANAQSHWPDKPIKLVVGYAAEAQ